MVNASTLTFQGELDRRLRDATTDWLATSASTDEMETRLQALPDGVPRIVVIIREDSEPFPGEESSQRCADTADRLGWRTVDRVVLPDGGTVDVMVQPGD
jgi:hypothetical protein